MVDVNDPEGAAWRDINDVPWSRASRMSRINLIPFSHNLEVITYLNLVKDGPNSKPHYYMNDSAYVGKAVCSVQSAFSCSRVKLTTEVTYFKYDEWLAVSNGTSTPTYPGGAAYDLTCTVCVRMIADSLFLLSHRS